MTVPESPAVILRRAAALLAERARETVPGRWLYDTLAEDDTAMVFVPRTTANGIEYAHGIIYTDWGTIHDAAWIATVHPRVAEPLVKLLEDAARRAETWSLEGSTFLRCALTLAQILLGEPAVADG